MYEKCFTSLKIGILWGAFDQLALTHPRERHFLAQLWPRGKKMGICVQPNLHLCQFCQGLCIASVAPLHAVHGTLREGSGTRQLTRMTLRSLIPIWHARQTLAHHPLHLHRMQLYQAEEQKGVLRVKLQEACLWRVSARPTCGLGHAPLADVFAPGDTATFGAGLLPVFVAPLPVWVSFKVGFFYLHRREEKGTFECLGYKYSGAWALRYEWLHVWTYKPPFVHFFFFCFGLQV